MFKHHMKGITGSAAGGVRQQDPYREMTPSGPYQFKAVQGRHSSNPTATKNLQYIQKYRTNDNSIGPSPQSSMVGNNLARYGQKLQERDEQANQMPGFSKANTQQNPADMVNNYPEAGLDDQFGMQQKAKSRQGSPNAYEPPRQASPNMYMPPRQPVYDVPRQPSRMAQNSSSAEKRFNSIEVPKISPNHIIQSRQHEKRGKGQYYDKRGSMDVVLQQNQSPGRQNSGYGSVIDQQRAQEEKMLIESDPFLLEEQRYLNRLQKASNIQENHYSLHYDKYTAPIMQKKKQQEEFENEIINRRQQSLAEAQERQNKMKQDLNYIHNQAIEKQVQTKNQIRSNEMMEKRMQKENLEKQTELLRNRDHQIKSIRQSEAQNYRAFLENQRRGDGVQKVTENIGVQRQNQPPYQGGYY